MLGVRHGFDLDHLATIDAITRTVKANVLLSKFVGFLFSLGHGIVVIGISIVIASGVIQAQAPLWLAFFGNLVSIIFLLLFGVLTLWNSLSNASGLPTGIKSFFWQKLLRKKYNPLLIMLIGAMFALSFDTFTQAALFTISASMFAGMLFTIMAGTFFMVGMMTADGLNGLFVAFLIQRADKKSKLIAQVVGILIGCFSLILGITGLLKSGL